MDNSNFKANIIKFDKGILYQPLFISDDLSKKIEDNSRLYMNWNSVCDFDVCFGETCELREDKHFFIGTRLLNNKKAYKHTVKTFVNNDKRDEYYDELHRKIRLSIQYLKEL